MAATNFTIKQGETWSRTISIEDSYCIPTLLADSNKTPNLYFAGMATKSGETSVPILFKYGEVEAKSYGRGSARGTQSGVFDLICYIPADEVGSCSVGDSLTKTDCDYASGIWTIDNSASLLTTSNMAAGDWEYEIRKGESLDISGTEVSITILYGSITVEDSQIDLSAGSSFTFTTPS